VNPTIEKVKTHLKENKTIYISAGVTAVLAGITYAIVRELHTTLDAGVDCPEREPMGSLIFSNSLFGSSTNNVVTTIHTGSKGNSGFVTKCIETGEIFATQGDAARAFGIPEEFMSKHLNYGRELFEDLHFERVGVLTA